MPGHAAQCQEMAGLVHPGQSGDTSTGGTWRAGVEEWRWNTQPKATTTGLASRQVTHLWMPRTRQVYVLGGEVWQSPPPPNDPPPLALEWGIRHWK